MILKDEDIEKLVQNTENIYFVYLLLRLLNDEYYFINDAVNEQFVIHCKKLIEKNQTTPEIKEVIKIKDTQYRVKLVKILHNNHYKVSIESLEKKPIKQSKVKLPTEYNESDIFHLSHNKKLILETRNDIARFSVNIVEKNLIIGGIEKITLYPLHLNYLYKTIVHLKCGKDFNYPLVATSTGSGKSFTQALFFLILYLSGKKAIFAVPNIVLAKQLYRDFQKLLPDNIVTEISVTDTNPYESKYDVITTHKAILEDHWKAPDGKSKVYFFDEADKITSELTEERLKILRKNFLTVLLTATPRETHLSESSIIYHLSPHEKYKLKIAKLASTKCIKTRSFIEKKISRNKISFYSPIILYSIFLTSYSLLAMLPFASLIKLSLVSLINKSLFLSLIVSSLESFINKIPFVNFIGTLLLGTIDLCVSLLISTLIMAILVLSYIVLEALLTNRITSLAKLFDIQTDDSEIPKFTALFKGIAMLKMNTELDKDAPHKIVSIAHEYIDHLEEEVLCMTQKSMIRTDDYYSFMKSEIRRPIQENSLIIVPDQNNTILLNLNHVFRGSKNNIYANNKLASRTKEHDHLELGIGIIENTYNEEIFLIAVEKFKRIMKKNFPKISDNELKNCLKKIDLCGQIHYPIYRVMHGLIDLTTYFLTKLDNISLNERRSVNLSEIVDLIKLNINNQDNEILLNDYLKEKGFSQILIKEIKPQVTELLDIIKKNINNSKFISMIASNWSLDRELHTMIKLDTPTFQEIYEGKPTYQTIGLSKRFLNFCNTHKIIFTGKKGDRTPFFSIQLKSQFAHYYQEEDYEIENFGDNTKKSEEIFKIMECPYSPEEISSLFRWNLTTCVDNGDLLGRGFSSLLLNSVAVLTHNPENLSTNDIVQFFGRNRGMDFNKQPFFFYSPIKNFDIKAFNKPNFLKYLLKKTKEEHSQSLKKRAEHIAENIINYIKTSYTKYQKHAHIEELMINLFRSFYNTNDFDINKTKQDFAIAITHIQKYLLSYRTRIENKNQRSFFSKIAFSILCSSLRLSLPIALFWETLYFYIKSSSLLSKKSPITDTSLYAFILKNYSPLYSTKTTRIIIAIYTTLDDKDTELSKINEEIIKYSLKDKHLSVFLKKLILPLIKNEINLRYLLNKLGFQEITPNILKKFLDDIAKEDQSYILKHYTNNGVYKDSQLEKILRCMKTISLEISSCHAYYYSVKDFTRKPVLRPEKEIFKLPSLFTNSPPFLPIISCQIVCTILVMSNSKKFIVFMLENLNIYNLTIIAPYILTFIEISSSILSITLYLHIMLASEQHEMKTFKKKPTEYFITNLLFTEFGKNYHPTEINTLRLNMEKSTIEYIENDVHNQIAKIKESASHITKLTSTEIEEGLVHDHIEKIKN